MLLLFFVDKLPALYAVPDYGNRSSDFKIITNNDVLAINTSNMLTIKNGVYLTMGSSGGKLNSYGFPIWRNFSNYAFYNSFDTSSGLVFVTGSEGMVILY